MRSAVSGAVRGGAAKSKLPWCGSTGGRSKPAGVEPFGGRRGRARPHALHAGQLTACPAVPRGAGRLSSCPPSRCRESFRRPAGRRRALCSRARSRAGLRGILSGRPAAAASARAIAPPLASPAPDSSVSAASAGRVRGLGRRDLARGNGVVHRLLVAGQRGQRDLDRIVRAAGALPRRGVGVVEHGLARRHRRMLHDRRRAAVITSVVAAGVVRCQSGAPWAGSRDMSRIWAPGVTCSEISVPPRPPWCVRSDVARPRHRGSGRDTAQRASLKSPWIPMSRDRVWPVRCGFGAGGRFGLGVMSTPGSVSRSIGRVAGADSEWRCRQRGGPATRRSPPPRPAGCAGAGRPRAGGRRKLRHRRSRVRGASGRRLGRRPVPHHRPDRRGRRRCLVRRPACWCWRFLAAAARRGPRRHGHRPRRPARRPRRPRRWRCRRAVGLDLARVGVGGEAV